jgi:hypothetical protein
MMSFRPLIKKIASNQKGVALFIVLAAMATLAIFVGEITYTAQINQKLAYDRLDQIKAQSLAKSGLRIALLRIRAYSELRKTISSMASAAGASADAVNAVVPKAILEKIWSEPITIPFSGDVSSLPTSARDALLKFRKDSGMEGKLYISIQAQSSRFNLNSTIAAFAPSSTPAKNPATTGGAAAPGAPGAAATPTPDPSSTPAAFDQAQARTLLTEQLKETFQKKFEDDEKFRDQYRNLRIEDLSDEILGWSDLTFESQRAQSSAIPFKQAPFYHVSELHYLPSVDDAIYDLLSPQYTAGVNSQINVNTITDSVLAALVPVMTVEERKKFFDYRAGIQESGTASASPGGDQENTFKKADEFFKYLQDKVAAFGGSSSKVGDFKTALTQRGIEIVTEENNFIVHIEATVQQTKRTLEANVTLLEDKSAGPNNRATPATGSNANFQPGVNPPERSNLKITQLRFL